MVHSAHPFACSFGMFSPLPRLEIHADGGPQTLARIVGLFAAQNLIPADLAARQSCSGIWVGLHIDVGSHQAERLAEKLRALVCVSGVILVPAAERTDRPTDDRPLAGTPSDLRIDAGAAGED